MNINKENYPAYFLDYHEGRLSAADEAALFVFLGMHPELQEAFDAYDPVSLSSWDGSAAFPGRDSLKRGRITMDNRDYYFAAYVEGDLSPTERMMVEAFSQSDPTLARELLLMQKAFLPAAEVTYPDKASLKRLVLTLPGAAAAAGSAPAAGTAMADSPAAATKTAVQQRPDRGAVVIPLLRRWMPHAAAAAVLMLLASLFFLRLPPQTASHLAQDTQQSPAGRGADDPVAVADIPLPGGTQGRRDGERERGSDAGTQGSTHMVAQGALTGIGLQRVAGIGAGSRWLAVPAARPSAPESRTEFAYWSPASLPGYTYEEDYLADGQPPAGSRDSGLAQLAVNRIGSSLPIDFSKAEEHIRENRFPLWVLAEAGLTELGNLATQALGITRETDQKGRTVAITAGDRFEARRSR